MGRLKKFWRMGLFLPVFLTGWLAGCLPVPGELPAPESTQAIAVQTQAESLATPGQEGMPTEAPTPASTLAEEEQPAEATPALLSTPTPVAVTTPAVSSMPVPAPGASWGDRRIYTAQAGDTLQAIANRFGVEPRQIECLWVGGRCATEMITAGVMTLKAHPAGRLEILPAGLPLFIPGQPAGATAGVRLLPDSAVIFSASGVGFDVAKALAETGGTLGAYQQYLMITGWTSAADVITRVAIENSIHPQLLVALLEYQCGCVRGRAVPADRLTSFMQATSHRRQDLYGQLTWAVEQLSRGYYGWRAGTLTEIQLLDGKMVKIPPDLNAGTVALWQFFARLLNDEDAWQAALDAETGFLRTYREMFGDPWLNEIALYPPGVAQPPLRFPFGPGETWSLTGGPHPAWEGYGPLASLDFAPPADMAGCDLSPYWVTAMAPGLVVRSELGVVIQDLDGDGLEQTGWVLIYLHIQEAGRVAAGTRLNTGDRVGHPSCEGGRATGTHVHIARKLNGEWIAADGPLAFDLMGWVAHNGATPYLGTLQQGEQIIIASTSANRDTKIRWENNE